MKSRAAAERISMHDAAQRAVREFVEHRDRVGHAASVIMTSHVDALRRLGE